MAAACIAVVHTPKKRGRDAFEDVLDIPPPPAPLKRVRTYCHYDPFPEFDGEENKGVEGDHTSRSGVCRGVCHGYDAKSIGSDEFSDESKDDVILCESCVHCKKLVEFKDLAASKVAKTGLNLVDGEWVKLEVVVCADCRDEADERDEPEAVCGYCEEHLEDFDVDCLNFQAQCSSCQDVACAGCTEAWLRSRNLDGLWEVHCDSCVESKCLSACFDCDKLIRETDVQCGDRCEACAREAGECD